MSKLSTFRDIIDLWPSRAVFADDVGVSVETVHKWAARGTVRAEYFFSILIAARRRGFAVSAARLCRIAGEHRINEIQSAAITEIPVKRGAA